MDICEPGAQGVVASFTGVHEIKMEGSVKWRDV
jgi:hypothetical protein